jgi:hypothetical protein
VKPEPFYATAVELRDALSIADESVLSDDAAAKLLEEAEDLVDDRLGPWRIDAESGRKIVVAEVEPWQAKKLAQATLEVAKVIFSDPGIASRQRLRSVSGDVATSGPYGPAYGERFEVLLSASGLAIKFAQARRGRGRNSRIVQSFEEDGR